MGGAASSIERQVGGSSLRRRSEGADEACSAGAARWFTVGSESIATANYRSMYVRSIYDRIVSVSQSTQLSPSSRSAAGACTPQRPPAEGGQKISLRRITARTVADICDLSETLTTEQRAMVADNAVSIADAHFSGKRLVPRYLRRRRPGRIHHAAQRLRLRLRSRMPWRVPLAPDGGRAIPGARGRPQSDRNDRRESQSPWYQRTLRRLWARTVQSWPVLREARLRAQRCLLW